MTWFPVGSGRVLPLGAALAAVGTAVLVVVPRLGGPLVVPLEVADRYWADDPIVPGQVAERGAMDTTVLMAVADAPAWLRLVTGAQPLLTLLAVALGVSALAGVVRTLAAGGPFEARNPARLRVVAVAVVLGGVVAPLADAAARQLVVERLDAAGSLTTRPDLTVGPVLVAVAVVACAEALRRGAIAAEEQQPVPTG